MRRPYGPLLLAMALGMFLLPVQGWAAGNGSGSSKQESAAAPARLFGSGKQEIAIAVGYAIPLPSGSSTPEIEDLQYVFLAPRWGIGITDPWGGMPFTGVTLSCWRKGSFSSRRSPRADSGGVRLGLPVQFPSRRQIHSLCGGRGRHSQFGLRCGGSAGRLQFFTPSRVGLSLLPL